MSGLFHLAAVSALASVIAGCSIIAPGPPATSDPSTSVPLTKTASPTPSHQPPPVSPFASLFSYLAHRAGQITAAVYDSRTGRTWVFHPGVRQDTASIVKVEIMGTALWEAQNQGKPPSAAERALMLPMIENSDNNAATLMLAAVGGPSAVQRFDRRAGLNDTTPSTQKYIPGTTLPGWGLTTTTAFDEARLVSRLAYPNSVLTPINRQYGLNLMEHVQADQAWGISAGVPPAGTTVAIKNGWLPLAGQGWQINSIGWVYGHGRDYVLAVLTANNPSEAYGIDTINTIAQNIYAELGASPGAAP